MEAPDFTGVVQYITPQKVEAASDPSNSFKNPGLDGLYPIVLSPSVTMSIKGSRRLLGLERAALMVACYTCKHRNL